MEFKIGRSANNDLCLDDNSISNEHALVIIEGDKFILKDLNSSNGTYVNGLRIGKKNINLEDYIKLGNYQLDNELLKNGIDTFIIKNKRDFTKEFNELENVYKQFQKKISKLNRNSKNKPLIIKLGIIVVLMVLVYILIGDITSLLIVGLLAGLITNFIVPAGKQNENKEITQLEYGDKFVCPKCRTSLIKKSWRYWKEKGECSNSKCDAYWNKNL